MAKGAYRAEDITVLKGLDPVKKRPDLFIGGTDSAGLHHLVWEILDNCIDEVMNGYASQIEVELDKDAQGIRIADNGRGIPVDLHREYQKPALELIMTTLHAGGKFGGSNYQYSGGLHGVGASVVNALSRKLEATVKRDGYKYFQAYKRGIPVADMERLEEARGTGTSTYFQPDPHVFAECTFDSPLILERLEARSYLHRVKIIFKDRTTGETHRLDHGQGIEGYLQRLVASEKEPEATPTVLEQVFFRACEQDPKMEVALQWTEEPKDWVRSYVNGIPTPQGGTHDLGFKAGVVRAVRNYMDTHNLQPKNLKLGANDLVDGLRAVISVFVREPQFKGQTKERLNNPEVQPQVTSALAPPLEQWLNNNPSVAEAIVKRIERGARERQEAADGAASRKTVNQRARLPGKLADCSSNRPAESEIFIVEGDSAGGSAKQGRDRKHQAILALRGKVLNTEQAGLSKIQQNKEILNLVSALGCGIGNHIDLSRLRYHRVVILTDADSDGHHIAGLLLTFFYRHMVELIKAGHIYLGRPPLYRVRTGKVTEWAWDERQKERLLKKLKGKPEVLRFKGLGEMSAQQLKETTLDPRTRTLLRVRIPSEEAADQAVRDCFGKDPAARFQFVMERAGEADDLDI